MNILFILPRQHPNQAGWYQALREDGHQVKYIVSYSIPINERQDLPDPYVVPSTAIPRWYSLVLWCYSLIAKQPIQKPYLLWPDKNTLTEEINCFAPDLIIIRECLTPLALMTQAIAHKKRIRTIHYSQAPLNQKDNLLVQLLRALRVMPEFRMTPTLRGHDSNIARDKVFYVPLFVPTTVAKIPEKNGNVVRLLFVGKYIERKNHLLLLEAFSKVLKHTPSHLTMVGSMVFANKDLHDKILARIKEIGLATNVTIKYDVNPIEMGLVYKDHDVFILPSVDEPFSISPLEAMACGLPVIVTDSNGCQFHVQDDINGYVVKSNDCDALVSALYKICDSANLERLKEGALDYAQHTNNKKNFLNHFHLLIERTTK